MTISEVVEALLLLHREHGDLDVKTFDSHWGEFNSVEKLEVDSEVYGDEAGVPFINFRIAEFD